MMTGTGTVIVEKNSHTVMSFFFEDDNNGDKNKILSGKYLRILKMPSCRKSLKK
jgi:hypothetical protein